MNQLINIKNQDGVFTVSSREVAENFGKRHDHTLRSIETLMENDPTQNWGQYFLQASYKDESGKSNKEYQLTRDGFSLLVMGFTGSEALKWKLKYIEAFNQMESQIRTSFSELSPQLQLLIGIEQKQKEHEKAIADTNTRIDGISDIVALNTSNWRADAKKLIVKIAHTLGGNEYIKDVNSEIFKALNERFRVSLERRLTLKRQRMAEEGVCKSTRDKLTKVDITAEDSKLIEGYVIIVKELAIKHGVACA